MITTVDYRDAMARFASGVTIVTTAGADGRWWGFTASSFSALSIDPPLILVCVAHDARCHPAFTSAARFRVNVLGPEHEKLARRFATKGADKFGGGEFRAAEDGLPVLDDALVSLRCRTTETAQGGDHTILIAHVEEAQLRNEGTPVVHVDRRYWDLIPREDANR
jgi:flavin reductase ActVB